MTNELVNLNPGTQRTRRNMMKMGAILASSAAGVTAAHAGPVKTILCGIFTSAPRCNCFLKGTKIETVEGERKIEALAIGDLLPTVSGVLRPIQWIGRYRIKKSDPSKAWAKESLPVRISRSALAPNVPHADLTVTALHSVLIDGVLVPAEALINGSTIAHHEPEGDEMEFFHIKLESHDVIYAEGAPAETLLHVDESFVNFAEYLREYGTPAEEVRCAPYVHVQGGRAELRSRMRSALSPWIDLRDPADVVRDRLEEGAYQFG
jgi:Hint domain